MNATSTLNGNLSVTTGGIGIIGNSYFKDILGVGYSYAPNTEYILNVNGAVIFIYSTPISTKPCIS